MNKFQFFFRYLWKNMLYAIKENMQKDKNGIFNFDKQKL